MSSTHPRENKHIGRGAHNIDCAMGDRVREDAVLVGASAKFMLNPSMKQHILSTGTNCFLLNPVLLTPCGA